MLSLYNEHCLRRVLHAILYVRRLLAQRAAASTRSKRTMTPHYACYFTQEVCFYVLLNSH